MKMTQKPRTESSAIVIQRGLPESCHAAAAALYDAAFGPKFSVAIKSDEQRLALLEACFRSDFAIVALAGDELVGIAGFHTPEGSLTGGMTYGGLLSRLGIVQGNWAALIFSLYERQPQSHELLMDGIAVDFDYRGQGIGSRLLDAIIRYAVEKDYSRVRLDVIDTNPRAQELYERKGFEAVKTERFPYLRWLLGFGAAMTMERPVDFEDRQRAHRTRY